MCVLRRAAQLARAGWWCVHTHIDTRMSLALVVPFVDVVEWAVRCVALFPLVLATHGAITEWFT